MLLSAQAIRRLGEDGLITPYDPAMVQPCSYDLKLGRNFLIKDRPAADKDRLFIMPESFCLAETIEILRVPLTMVATIHGKSSWGRKGLLVHVTAGLVDPGWDGRLTLELKNVSSVPLVLRTGEPIAQVVWQLLDEATDTPYRGRYQYAKGVEASKP